MEKRFNSNTYDNIVKLVERLSDKNISQQERMILTRGADEVDLVRSGLEETMVSAYHEIRETFKQKRKIQDLRTAAFVSALKKISNDYESLGVFP